MYIYSKQNHFIILDKSINDDKKLSFFPHMITNVVCFVYDTPFTK